MSGPVSATTTGLSSEGDFIFELTDRVVDCGNVEACKQVHEGRHWQVGNASGFR
jgi:hypothetical protein